jgi:hypothetical protein
VVYSTKESQLMFPRDWQDGWTISPWLFGNATFYGEYLMDLSCVHSYQNKGVSHAF